MTLFLCAVFSLGWIILSFSVFSPGKNELILVLILIALSISILASVINGACNKLVKIIKENKHV